MSIFYLTLEAFGSKQNKKFEVKIFLKIIVTTYSCL